ncbi:hypothetical protein BD779DRAFT_1677298 [Infundibulicybe gibba]|nr:hypothetical protein BD779DRAFT_1677298 [Infundibulicybe gibba]
MPTDLDTALGNLSVKDNSVLCEPLYHHGSGKGKFYVILVGPSWEFSVTGKSCNAFASAVKPVVRETVRPHVEGFNSCQHKSFTTFLDAREYWDTYCRATHSHGTALPPYIGYSTLAGTARAPTHSDEPTLPATSVRSDRQIFYVVRPINARLAGASLYSNRSTALAALANAGNGWELLGTEGLEAAEWEILRGG